MRNLNRHQVKFEEQQARLAEADRVVTAIIERDQPDILFQSALQREITPNIDGYIRSRDLRRMMAAKGYEALRKPGGGLWAKGRFRSEVAFVLRQIAPEKRIEVVLAALAALAALEDRGS